MVEVKFSCKSCGIVDETVHVRERFANEADDHYLLTAIKPEIRVIHHLRSLLCTAESCEVKIPVTEQA